MRKQKKPCIVFFLAAIICLASACVGSEPADEGFIGGDQGLAVSFQNVPSETHEGSQIPVTILVENKGEQDLSDGVLCIAGPVIYGDGRLNQIEDINLTGAKKIAGSPVPGGQKIVNYIATAPPVLGDTPVTISATVRYAYRTTGQANVCISPNVIAQALGQQICQPNELKPVSSSSGPIQITELREIASSSDQITNLIFLVKVKNIGGGLVYDSFTNFNDGCTVSDADLLEHMNKLDIESAKIGTINPVNLECEQIQLVGNEGTTTCSGSISNVQSAYEEPLYLTLEYIYTQLATQKLAIRNIN